MADSDSKTGPRRAGPLDEVLSRPLGGERARLSAIGPRTMLNLRGDPTSRAFTEAAGELLGVALPLSPNRWQGNQERAVLWLGPDEWLVMAPDGKSAAIATKLATEFDHDPWVAVIDLSHSYTGFLLAGSLHRDVLAKGCHLDLHERAFRHGDCAQTLLASARVLLRSVEEGEATEIWVRNSFALYLAEWLEDAVAEYAS